MLNLLLVVSLFASEIFFSFMSLANSEYTGSDSSNVYIIYRTSIFVLIFISFVVIIWFSKKVTKVELLFIIFVAIFMAFVFGTVSFQGSLPSPLRTAILTFGTITSSGVLSGFILSRKNNLTKMIKWLDLVMIITTLGLLSSARQLLIINNAKFSTFAGANYQITSYMAATFFLINLFFYLNNNKLELLFFAKKSVFKIIRLLLMIFQLIIVLISGGRGGLVLLLIGSLFCLYLSIKSIKKLLFLAVTLVFLLFTFLSIEPYLNNFSFFTSGVSRISEFISSNGVNWDKTAGRNYIYKDALNLISKSPFWGYGLASSYYILQVKLYPHNFFLEILLDGGLIYLAIWLLILIVVIYKLVLLVRFNFHYTLMVLLFLIAFIPLMFSYSYWSGNPIFWFVISFTLSTNIKKVKEISCNE